jgi:hypothetical protein
MSIRNPAAMHEDIPDIVDPLQVIVGKSRGYNVDRKLFLKELPLLIQSAGSELSQVFLDYVSLNGTVPILS